MKDEVGVTDTITRKNIRAVNVGLNASFQDKSDYTQLNINNVFGKLNIKSTDALAMDEVSAKTHGNYYKLTAGVSRPQFLTPKWRLSGGLSGQLSNKNLDSSEQISLGRADAVSADRALIGQVETSYAVPPNWSVGAFYEVGHGKLRHKPFTDGDNSVKLHGGGVRVQGQVKGLSLNGKVAWEGSEERFSRHKNPRVWVQDGYNF